MRALLLVPFLLASAGTSLLPARAADTVSPWAGIPEAEVRLVAGSALGSALWLGLEFAMAPKWKIYWRSPGDAGYPPVPDWRGSSNLAVDGLAWPLPEHFIFYGLHTYGYSEQVVLPVKATRPDPEQPTAIRLDLSYAACADICVPVEAELALTLPAGEVPANRHGAAIAQAMAEVPASEGGAAIEWANATLDEARPALEFEVATAVPVERPAAIVEGPAGAAFERPSCRRTEALRVRCSVAFVARQGPDVVRGADLVLTLYGEGFAAETKVRAGR